MLFGVNICVPQFCQKKKKKWEKQRTESAILSILGAILSGGGSIVQVKIGDGDFTLKPYFLLVTYLEN